MRANAAVASQLYNAQLASLAVPGVAIRYYDIADFIEQLQVNARAYGFTQILPLQPGASCDAICQQTSIFADTIHLTSHTQQLIGDYVASGNPIYNNAGFVYDAIETNIESAAAALSLGQRLAGAEAGRFAGALLDRLDATRGLAYAPVGGEGRPTPWTVYAYGGASGGMLAPVGTPSSLQGDLDTTLAGVTAGAEYRASPAVRFGAAFDYAHVDANLQSTIGATARIDSFQGALYASATFPRLFLDGIVAGGSASLDQTREGIFGSLHAAPNARLFTATGRVGYLLPVGPVKVGPVGGLLYARTTLGGSTENGEAFYAITTEGSTTSSLYGQGGVELRLADPSFLLIDPFVTLTYNRQFDRGFGTVGSALAFLPTQALPGAVLAPSLDFVKLAVGSTVELGPRWYGTVTAFGVKGQASLAAGGGNVGLAYRF